MSETVLHPQVTILLDMDGVVVDFVGGAARLFGADPATLFQPERDLPGEFDMYPALGLARGDFYAGLDNAGGALWPGLQA